MSRTIKFRAWDMKRSRMVADSDIASFDWAAKNCLVYDDKGHGNLLQAGEHALMQYTGLLDKNGKEIYEGDILVHTDYDSKPKKVQWNEVSNAWNIRPYRYTEEQREVIGNIYEHPELLSNE